MHEREGLTQGPQPPKAQKWHPALVVYRPDGPLGLAAAQPMACNNHIQLGGYTAAPAPLIGRARQSHPGSCDFSPGRTCSSVALSSAALAARVLETGGFFFSEGVVPRTI